MKNKMFFSYSSEHRVMTEMAERFHKDGEDSPRPLSDETLDTLFHGKVRLWQSRRGHRFSLDALLLTHFATMKSGERVADLGTGNGVIPLIMARRHAKIAITGFEFQQTMVERALRNVKLNQMEKRIQICRGDVRAISDVAASESFDAVVCNPPYRKSGSGRISPNDERQIARHEIHGELKNFLDAAAYLLRLKGRLALVYLANRTVDLLTSMRHAHIEPKRMRLVHSFIGTDASLVLVEGIKGGKSGVEIMRPLVVYRRANQYGAEVAALIAGRK